MTTNNKLVENFRAKIKDIFKESVDKVNEAEEQAPVAPAAPIAPPAGADGPIGGAPAGAEGLPPVEEEKVTLTVSLLKSLLDWAHGEEEVEGEGEEGEEAAPEAAPEAEPAAPVVEAAPAAPVAPEAPAVDGAEGLEGAEGEGLEDAGVEAIEIQALVDKVKELSASKGELTDEDFGEIVAAAEGAEGAGEGEGENLEGILGGEGAEEPPTGLVENIGEIIPKGAKFKNEGNKGIGK